MKIIIPTKKEAQARWKEWIKTYNPTITPKDERSIKSFPTTGYDIELYKWHMNLGRYFYQNHLYGWILHHAPIKPPFSLGIDIGANVGQHSIMMSQMCKRVMAFEPHPITFKFLKRNIDINNIDNVEYYDVALGDVEKTGKITDRLMSGSNHIKAVNSKTPSEYRVDIRPLDWFGISKVHLIKVDVECYELELLNGMEQTLMQNNPYVILESHKGRWETPYMFDFMFGNGYEVLAHFQNNIIFRKK